MQILAGICVGIVAWFLLRILLMGVYTVDQNERAVKTRFGRAVRVPGGKTTLDDPDRRILRPEERARYTYPQVRVIQPGGPYFKMPWEKIHKVSIATITVNMALDPGRPHGQRERHAPGGGHQGSAQYRADRADPLPRERGQSVRLPVRHQEALRARDGLLRFRAAAAHRQLRGQGRAADCRAVAGPARAGAAWPAAR